MTATGAGSPASYAESPSHSESIASAVSTIALEDGDVIRIPRTSQLVQVHGEVFLPNASQRGEPAWTMGPALPAGRSGAGVIGTAGMVRVIGRVDPAEPQQLLLLRRAEAWQVAASPELPVLSQPALVLNGTYLHLLGGQIDQTPSDQHLASQAVYLVPLPFLSP